MYACQLLGTVGLGASWAEDLVKLTNQSFDKEAMNEAEA